MPSLSVPEALARVMEEQRIRRAVTARLAEQRRHHIQSAGIVAALVLLVLSSTALILAPVILR